MAHHSATSERQLWDGNSEPAQLIGTIGTALPDGTSLGNQQTAIKDRHY